MGWLDRLKSLFTDSSDEDGDDIEQVAEDSELTQELSESTSGGDSSPEPKPTDWTSSTVGTSDESSQLKPEIDSKFTQPTADVDQESEKAVSSPDQQPPPIAGQYREALQQLYEASDTEKPREEWVEAPFDLRIKREQATAFLQEWERYQQLSSQLGIGLSRAPDITGLAPEELESIITDYEELNDILETTITLENKFTNRFEDIIASTTALRPDFTQKGPSKEILDDYRAWLAEWIDNESRWRALNRAGTVTHGDVSVTNLRGVGEGTAEQLENGGIRTIAELRAHPVDALTAIEGIGQQRATTLRARSLERSVEEIHGVGDRVGKTLKDAGYTAAIDIAAVAPESLTELPGIGGTRAERIHSRASGYIDVAAPAPEWVQEEFAPDWCEYNDAQSTLNTYERFLIMYGELHKPLEQIDAHSSGAVPVANELTTQLLQRLSSRIDQNGDITNTRNHFFAIADAVAQMDATLSDQPLEMSDETKEILGLEDLPPFELARIELSCSESLEDFGRFVQRHADIATARVQLIELTDDAASAYRTAEESSVPGSDALADGLSAHVSESHQRYRDSERTEVMISSRYLDTVTTALQFAESHHDYPTESFLKVLGELGTEAVDDADTIDEHARIIETASEAVAVINDLGFDHPAVHPESWADDIRTALAEQYAPGIAPLESQLDRLRDGVWKREDLQEFDWDSFEALIGSLYAEDDYDVTVTKGSADLGIDVLLSDDETDIAVQVKRFAPGNTVGREPLQKLVSTLAKGDADHAIVVTSSSFAKTARRYAEDFGSKLELVDGDALVAQLSESSIPPP